MKLCMWNKLTIVFKLLAVRMAVVKRAVELEVTKPLGRVQKVGDCLWFLG